ncbi:uroporphyrinogen-III synthase-like isoform X2 [Ischnura elegans]|uniref:uroporphyrinogen-III synthase-like isoform X2 n=1 Tax=Ischnura elegans TaxID=197161 RepID=UPI001ED87D82|nr:uroporphyrinogen-III synthase-like isoform X2 [Ischnura elegans]
MAKSAIIFKAVDGDGRPDAYEREFQEAGIDVTIIPPIDFTFCNLDVLFEKLNDPGSYSGIIFTSPRAVKGVALSLGDQGTLNPGWKTCSIFVVGESTSRCLLDHLGLESEGKESGNAKELGEEIAKREFSKPLLFPCGNLKTDTLPQFLMGKNIYVEEVMVYETCQHPLLEENLNGVLKEVPDFIIFFSPSGVKYTVPMMKSSQYSLDKVKLISIGPSTTAALLDHGINVWATAKKPNPCSLLEAIVTLRNE